MANTTERSLKVFLCHSSGDKPAIRALYKNLTKRGIDVWLDEEKLLPGQDWQMEIPAAVKNSDAIIVCLSNSSITKEGYIQKEINYSLSIAEEKPEGTIFIIPARLEDCNVPSRLSKWQYVDLFFKDGIFSSKGYEMLIKALNNRAIQVGAKPPKDFIVNPYYPIIPQPLLIVISGPSGVGKDTLLNKMKERNLPFHFVTTSTTRSPRDGEIHGKDYFFLSNNDFARMIEENELLEYAIVYGDYKGVPKQQIRDALQNGKDVVLRIDVQGAETIRKIAPESVLIFLTTENEEALLKRLKQKSAESDMALSLRITTARKELTHIKNFDYLIVNRDSHLDETLEAVQKIIQTEHYRVTPRKSPSL